MLEERLEHVVPKVEIAHLLKSALEVGWVAVPLDGFTIDVDGSFRSCGMERAGDFVVR